MLNFSLSEEQSALAETARRFARERIIPAAAVADRDAHFPREIFEEALERAVEALRIWLNDGIEAAMRHANRKPSSPDSSGRD